MLILIKKFNRKKGVNDIGEGFQLYEFIGVLGRIFIGFADDDIV